MIILRSAAPKTRVPKGGIWLHNDTTPPDGTERFTSADNRLIAGAGNSYASGATGGSNSVSLSGSTGSGGNHSANPSTCFDHPFNEGSGIYSFSAYAGSADGAHTHDYDSGTFVPAQRKVVMVKATRNLKDFPAKALLMSTAAQSITENTDFTDKYFQCNSTIENVAESSSIDLSVSGSHDHGMITGESSDNVYFKPQCSSGGSHGGTLTPDSITESIKKVRLSMWTHATDRIKAANNFVIMWESAIAPPGWAFCDGINGNPDMRDCFILPCETGSENTTAAGNNTIDMVLSGTTEHTVNHEHFGSNHPGKTVGTGCHNYYTWVHTHSLSTRSGVSYLPPYYALYFIIKV